MNSSQNMNKFSKHAFFWKKAVWLKSNWLRGQLGQNNSLKKASFSVIYLFLMVILVYFGSLFTCQHFYQFKEFLRVFFFLFKVILRMP